MTTIDLATTNTDDVATEQLRGAMETIEAYYRSRGIFGDCFGFGERPAILVVDFANGWTDEAYAGGSRRLDPPVESLSQPTVGDMHHPSTPVGGTAGRSAREGNNLELDLGRQAGRDDQRENAGQGHRQHLRRSSRARHGTGPKATSV